MDIKLRDSMFLSHEGSMLEMLDFTFYFRTRRQVHQLLLLYIQTSFSSLISQHIPVNYQCAAAVA